MNSQQQLQAGLRAIIQPVVTEHHIEWPLLTKLPTEALVQLLQLYDVHIPFGQQLAFQAALLPDNLLHRINNAPLTSALTAKIKLVPSENSDQVLTNYELVYPTADAVRRPTVATLRQLGVPEGRLKRQAPAHATVMTAETEDYYLYANTTITLEKHLGSLDSLKKRINHPTDPLLQKSMLLTAFVLTEGFLKAQLVAAIPSIPANVRGTAFQTIVMKDITQKLRSPRGRADLYQLFFDGHSLPTIPHLALRNLLAHDSTAVTITNGKVTYLNEDHHLESVDAKNLLTELQRFAKELN